jgi:predicted nucleic acid-binding protein
LDVLRELHRVVIPQAVAGELEARPGAPGGGVPYLEWVERRRPSAAGVGRVASEPPAIGPGERETIALALETGATAVMDDRRGRRRARSLGVPVTGTLGVLQAIHRTGHAGRGFAEDLAALGSAGMYLTAELRQRVFDRFHAGDAPRERT